MAVNGAGAHQNGNGVASFSGPPRYAPAMYAIPIEQPVVTLDAKTAFQVSQTSHLKQFERILIIIRFYQLEISHSVFPSFRT